MKLEEQVLNREQVQELIELGFDVRKYATSAVIEAKDGNHYIVDRRLLSINMGFMETEVIEYFETLSIGDIMQVLPPYIEEECVLNINQNFILYEKEGGMTEYMEINLIVGNSIINNHFEMLKYCIQEKYI